MRRIAQLSLAALILGVIFWSALLLDGRLGPRNDSRVVARAVALAARAVVGKAVAGQALQFKPVPPESVRTLETSRPRRHGATIDIEPRIPKIPEPPGVVPAPDAPEASVPGPIDVDGRSGDMMRIGQDIRIERGQTITGDVVAIGGDVVVDGHIEGDVQAMGGDVYLNGTARVDGDVVSMGGRLHEEDGAQVGGRRVTALGPREHRWERRLERLHERSRDFDPGRPFRRMFGMMIVAIVFIGIAWLFTWLAPGRSGGALARFRGESGQSFLVGLLVALVWAPGFIAVALVAAVLCITLIGIPVAVALLIAYPCVVALLWICGFAVGATALGHRILVHRGDPTPRMPNAAVMGAAAIGGALVAGVLLHNIPSFGILEGLGKMVEVLGWVLVGLISTIGAGSLVRHEFAQGPLRRWWTGRSGTSAPSAPAPVAAPAVAPPPAAAAPMPPASPPSPESSSSFMPPGDPPPAG